MTPHYLKTQRNKLGLSQYELSGMSRVSRFKITCFECGYKEFTEKELLQIKTALSKKEASHVRDSRK